MRIFFAAWLGLVWAVGGLAWGAGADGMVRVRLGTNFVPWQTLREKEALSIESAVRLFPPASYGAMYGLGRGGVCYVFDEEMLKKGVGGLPLRDGDELDRLERKVWDSLAMRYERVVRGDDVLRELAKPSGGQASEGGVVKAGEGSAAEGRPVWDMARLREAPVIYPAELKPSDPRIRAVFFEGVPFHGKPTRVFAWVGVPEVKPGEKAPGMVLVHGGNGTAFERWVKWWVDRGYAAIAMDTCGAMPAPEGQPHARHEFSGPAGWGGFDQMGEKQEDQWAYHAVAAGILANSLLRSQPGVDAERIGITGISWGGYLTCLIAGTDDRFRLAAPVYGCGFTLENAFGAAVQKGTDHGAQWMAWWDPSHYLPRVKVPMLWLTGSNDAYYWLPAWQKSYRLIAPELRHLSVRLRMVHAHGPMSEEAVEIGVFADRILRGGEPLVEVVSQKREGRRVSVEFKGGRPVVKAELNFTRDATSAWPERKWETAPCEVKGDSAVGELPGGTKFWFVNLLDDRGCVVSSEQEAL